MIIGYSILYVNQDTTVKDVLWERRTVYSNWNKALEVAHKKAETEKKRNDEYYLISVVNSKSQSVCDKNGNTQVFTLNHKSLGEVGNIYIVPVHDE